jgi:hypothetical protein
MDQGLDATIVLVVVVVLRPRFLAEPPGPKPSRRFVHWGQVPDHIGGLRRSVAGKGQTFA